MKSTILGLVNKLNPNNIEYSPVFFKCIKNYNRQLFVKDVIAGILVGVVALPLAIAFGIASGVTPEKGIISCVIAGIFVSMFGGSKFQISGPTGALIVIVSGVIQNYGMSGLAIATFISGAILVFMGLFKAGSIIKFIPYPIIIGFTSGIAVTIFTSQVKDMLGLPIETMPVSFIDKWSVYFQSLGIINYWSVGATIATIVIIRIFAKISKRIPSYLITIIIMTVTAYVLRTYFGIESLQTIGDKFTISAAIPKPSHLGITVDNIQNLFSAGLTIAIFGSIVTLLSATVADGATSESHNPNDELVGQGIANIISPIFGGIPVTGAIARTLTNINNGGRTPVSGIVHAIVLLIILLFLGNLSELIPIASLAGILAVVSYNMSEWRLFVSLMKIPKADVTVLIVTFLLTVIFDLTIAIEVGLLLAVVMFIRRTSETASISVATNRINTSENTDVSTNEVITIPKGVEVYEIEGPFFFGVANKFDEMRKNISSRSLVRVIRMRHVPFIDSTGLHNLEILARNSKREHIAFILSGVNTSVKEAIIKSGVADIIGEEYICDNIHSALELSKKIIADNIQKKRQNAKRKE